MICRFLYTVCFLQVLLLAQAASSYTCQPSPKGSALAFEVEPVLDGFEIPTFVTNAGDGSGRLFITDKGGRVWIVKGGRKLAEPFLNIQDKVIATGEQGLLSLAFHPDYKRNGRFFIFYNTPLGQTSLSVLAEYHVSRDPNKASPQERTILTLEQAETPIHKSGQLAFGPDGYLYASFGDADVANKVQDLATLNGKIVRIDISDETKPYTIPQDNPFVNQKKARGEIWAYGLRNPWRFSFDPCTGQLFAADVGTSSYEELDLVKPGENYGWPVFEGPQCMRPDYALNCDNIVATEPYHWYAHLTEDENGGNGVIGGYVYRGKRHPQLRGSYIFGDTASSRIWSLATDEGLDTPISRERTVIADIQGPITSFGLDESGEIYTLGLWTGILYRLTRQALDPSEGNLLETPQPKTIGLENLGAVSTSGDTRRAGLAPRSVIDFYLDKPEDFAFYFELVSQLPEYGLTVTLNGQVLASHKKVGQDLVFDWLMLEGRKGQNRLLFEYEIDGPLEQGSPSVFTFHELEIEKLESAN